MAKCVNKNVILVLLTNHILTTTLAVETTKNLKIYSILIHFHKEKISRTFKFQNFHFLFSSFLIKMKRLSFFANIILFFSLFHK